MLSNLEIRQKSILCYLLSLNLNCSCPDCCCTNAHRKLQINKTNYSSKWQPGITVTTCFVMVPIAMVYNENKTSCGTKKQKKEARQKFTAVVQSMKEYISQNLLYSKW